MWCIIQFNVKVVVLRIVYSTNIVVSIMKIIISKLDRRLSISNCINMLFLCKEGLEYGFSIWGCLMIIVWGIGIMFRSVRRRLWGKWG